MFNSQNDEILTRYFLLTIQNLRLQQQLSNKAIHKPMTMPTPSYNVDHIKNLQISLSSMSMQLKHKQQKIHELNIHIKQLHNGKQNIQQNMQKLQYTYQNMQDKYKKEITEYRNKIMSYQLQQQTDRYSQEHKYHISLLEKQKQQLQDHIKRLTNVTMKELQVDIQILNKQNQSLIGLINNYRTEENKYKIQKNKYEETIKKLTEQITVFEKSKEQNQKGIKTMSQQNQRWATKFAQLQKKYKKQSQKILKNYTQILEQNVQKISQTQTSLSKLKQLNQNQAQQIQRKSKKLKQYDQQYHTYLNKMNNLSLEAAQVKQQNTKMKQTYENMLKQMKQKYEQWKTKSINEIKKQNIKNIQKHNNQIKQMQQKYKRQKIQDIKNMQQQLIMLKNQLDNSIRQQQQILIKVTEERDNAIKQWQDLLSQMDKQKIIISSLQKQIQSNRRNNLANTISQQSMNTNNANITNNANNMNNMNNINNKKVTFIQVKNQQKLRVEDLNTTNVNNQDKQYYNYKKQNRNVYLNTDDQTYQYQEKQQQQVLNNNQNNKQCCQECQTHKSSIHIVDARTPKNSNIPLSQKYRQVESCLLPSRPLAQIGQNRTGKLNQRKLFNQQCQKQKFHSYRSDQLVRHQIGGNISNKRRDDGYKKYQYIRTKTQQSLGAGQFPYEKEKGFFKDHIHNTTETGQANSQTQPYQPNLSKNNQRTRSLSHKDYSALKRTNFNQKQNYRSSQQKITRASSLKKVDYDATIQEIQQYLSFDIKSISQSKNMSRSSSDKKLRDTNQAFSQRLKTYTMQYEQRPQKSILMQKINKINSWRGDTQSKQSKTYNFYKKPNMTAAPNRMNTKFNQYKSQRQNINQIIHKKCQYMSEK